MAKDLRQSAFGEPEEEAVSQTRESENPFGPTKRELEKKYLELQKKQREESLRILGYDVLDSHCPHCQEKYCLFIEDEGKQIPASLRFLTIFVPRLKNTEVTLRCTSCDKEYTTPSLLFELAIPIALIALIAAVIIGDAVLISFLCRY
ncbi:hypothetical protein IKW72_00895 [bacterium]|nr:hypothetical protein [bacterium]